MDEKLIELVRKCEELYDTSNKKFSDSVCKEIRRIVTESGKNKKYRDNVWKEVRSTVIVSGRK
jgi:hypothetical protein